MNGAVLQYERLACVGYQHVSLHTDLCPHQQIYVH
jgi:hypothetical protein